MPPRKTRAAAKAQTEDVESVGDANKPSTATPEPEDERDQLRSITPNSADSGEEDPPIEADMPKPKGKKGKKGAGKKKGKKVKSDSPQGAPEQETVEAAVADTPVVPHNEPVTAVLPAVEEAADGSKENPSGETHEPIAEARPESPSAKPVRVTRRQLAMAEAHQDPEVGSRMDTVDEESLHRDLQEVIPTEVDQEEVETTTALDNPAEVLSTPEIPVETHEQTPQHVEEISEEAAAITPASGDSAIGRLTLEPLTAVTSLSPRQAQPNAEDPIDALDALEDAIDEVGKIIPGLDSPLSPGKPHPTKSGPSKLRAPPSTTTKKPVAGTSKTPATKTTTAIGRAPSVRTKAAPKIANTSQPSAISRTAPKAANPLARSTTTRTRPVSMILPKGDALAGAETKAPAYLAAKRRPISMSFPTPPPPLKSTKPLTQSTFRLPGDAVAAKLKAARAERVKREEEEAAKKKEFKARPMPSSVRSKPIEVKQTAASRARLSIGGALELVKGKENMATNGIKRSSTVTSTLSNSTKRNSVIAGTSKRSSIIGGGLGAAIPPLKRSSIAVADSQKAFSSSISIPKRTIAPTAAPSANTSAKRLSSMASPTTSLKSRSFSTASGSSTKAPVNKGKEVFNRDRLEKDAREKERKEKDEAMKKARAEAAERGRQASRDWAEKQKRALAGKGNAKVEQGVAPGAEAVTV